MGIILLVCFVVVMLVWLLALLGALPDSPRFSPWLAFIACLIVGLAVFVVGPGMVVVAR